MPQGTLPRCEKMPFVLSESSLGYSAMLPDHWMPQSDPMIPSFGGGEVKNGNQAPHVAPSSEMDRFRHKSMAVNELKQCLTPKKTGGVTVYGYRYYTPKTGQFLGRDPIGEKGGMNLYGFCANRPTVFVDKDGRVWFLVGIALVILTNPDIANAPGPTDPVYTSNGAAGMVVDLGGGAIGTITLRCCGKILGVIKYEIIKVQAIAARDALAKAVGRSKSTAIGVFDAKTGAVTGSVAAKYVAQPTPALTALADELGGVGTKTACNTVGCCAEFHGADTLVDGGSLITNIRFTPAVEPRTGNIKPACENCLSMFSSNFKAGAVPIETPRLLFIPINQDNQ
jgi:RHS repeat-associated protein